MRFCCQRKHTKKMERDMNIQRTDMWLDWMDKYKETKNCIIYVILGYDVDGSPRTLVERIRKQVSVDVDRIKRCSVGAVLFLVMDCVSGPEEGSKAIFPNVVVQRCIVYLVRNSIKYVLNIDYKKVIA